jgi:hypothetical protein
MWLASDHKVEPVDVESPGTATPALEI